MNFLRRVVWPAFALLVAITVITGAAYPALVTAIAQVVFPNQANGSMITAKNGQVVGSVLIGQCFDEPQYLWGRPSAAGATDANPCGYDGTSSAGTNLGPTSQTLLDDIAQRVAALQAANGGGPVPVDLVTSSASGLDPEISPQAADYQVARIAAARNLSPDAVEAVIARHTQQPLLGLLGEPRVNVLLTNLDLDGLLQSP
jgi:potassium-transporting ATPase KdpC subunit